MDGKTKKELENVGMSRIDILDIEYWEKNLGKSNLISRLVVKAYRKGLLKGLRKGG